MVSDIIPTICLSHLVQETALGFVLQHAVSFVLKCIILLGVFIRIISLAVLIEACRVFTPQCRDGATRVQRARPPCHRPHEEYMRVVRVLPSEYFTIWLQRNDWC